jgi:hypothetical protein
MLRPNIIAAFSVLLPIIAGLITYRQQQLIFKALVFFFVFSGGVDLITNYLWFYHLSNLIYLNFYNLIQTIVYIALFLPLVLKKRKTAFTISIIIVWVLIFVASTIYLKGLYQYNTFFIVSECIPLIFIAAVLLLRTTSNPIFRLRSNGLFWIGMGLLIYFSLSLAVFVIVDIEIRNNVTSLNGLWIIHSIVNIAANGLYAVAFLCRTPKEIISSL